MNECVAQAKKFLKNCNATMEIKYTGLETVDWDHYQHAAYDCTIITQKGEMRVHFYVSVIDTQKCKVPNEYDILSHLQKYDVGDIEDFIFDFGYEIKKRGDLKRIQHIYNTAVKQYSDICRCFTEEQIEAMREIWHLQ